MAEIEPGSPQDVWFRRWFHSYLRWHAVPRYLLAAVLLVGFGYLYGSVVPDLYLLRAEGKYQPLLYPLR
jgi:hypothetical protein